MRRRAKQLRRSRKTVLVAAGLFVLSQLALALAAETILPELRDPSFGARRRLLAQCIRDAPNQSLVLALGSSRIETGLQPSAMNRPEGGPRIFNFGLTGGGPLQEWLAFRRLNEDGFRPKSVVIEIMPALLFDSRPVEQCVHPERLSWRDVDDLLPDTQDAVPFVRGWGTARSAPIYSSRFIILSRLMPVWLPIANRTDYLWTDLDRWGAAQLPPSVTAADRRREGSARAREEYAERLDHFEVSPRPAGYLLRLLNECRAHRIAAILVLMPEDQTFQSLYSQEASECLDAFLSDVTREFGVRLINARQWLPASDFYDGHHLLPDGAHAFSAELAKALWGNTP